MSWFSRGAMRNQYETGAIKATYSYTDINNNLRVAQDAAGLTTSTYDGDNLRRKIVSGSVTTTFVWDGADYLQIKPLRATPRCWWFWTARWWGMCGIPQSTQNNTAWKCLQSHIPGCSMYDLGVK
ncbi:MAG: hypothetical protein K8H77_06035 [Cutibacterium acnes]|nr:hypothetical protein [Cutibacterium acnes]